MYNKAIFQRCFPYKGRYWYRNLKYIPRYFKSIHYLIKHGYDECAVWETFDWFIETMKPILTKYRQTHRGYPLMHDNTSSQSQSEQYDADLDRMIALLEDMDEASHFREEEDFADMRRHAAMMEAAKDEFFTLFSKYFYTLWD